MNSDKKNTTDYYHDKGVICADGEERSSFDVNTGCKSIACQQCAHYVKFLTVSTMQMICWNKGCFYKDADAPATE